MPVVFVCTDCLHPHFNSDGSCISCGCKVANNKKVRIHRYNVDQDEFTKIFATCSTQSQKVGGRLSVESEKHFRYLTPGGTLSILRLKSEMRDEKSV